MKKWSNWNWACGRDIDTHAFNSAEILQSSINILITLTSMLDITSISLKNLRRWTIFNRHCQIEVRKVVCSSYRMGGYCE